VPGDGREAPSPTPWQTATITAIRAETARAKTFTFALERPFAYWPGQHCVLRLTAPDGYTASRSYSIASAPGDPSALELTVEHLPDGEVSSFLHEVVEVGDDLELRGPIGKYFVWEGDTPALLVGGGSGVVPLMSMLRYARRAGHDDLLRLIVSVRRPADLYYADEIMGPESTVIFTRETPMVSTRAAGRLMAEDVKPAIRDGAGVYVCGSSGFADAATDLLVGNGVDASVIRVERFGPTA